MVRADAKSIALGRDECFAAVIGEGGVETRIRETLFRRQVLARCDVSRKKLLRSVTATSDA